MHREFVSPKKALSILALAAGLLPGTALAAVPRIVGTPAVTNPSFDGVANTMMYDVGVTVDAAARDADHAAVVGYVADADYTTCSGTTAWKWAAGQSFDTRRTRTWRLYNFVPGTTYRYKVMIGTGAGARVRCGTLATTAAPTPTLPTNLSYLDLQYAVAGASNPADTNYVLVETDDCGGSGTSSMGARDYVVVVDPFLEAIVWYLDIGAMSGVRGASSSGFRYQPGTTATSGRVMISIDRRYLYEWGFDGTEVAFHDFGTADECDGVAGSEGPCVHHDSFKLDSSGNTYVLSSQRTTMDAIGTEWESVCGTTATFIDDGYSILDSTGALLDQHYLMADYGYDPTVDGGPTARALASRPTACDADTWRGTFDPAVGAIDWTHTNSIAASQFGADEVIDLSIKEWSQIVRIDAATGDLVWKLSSIRADSDWWPITTATGIVGATKFSGQHDVQAIDANTLLMMDNHGDPNGARVLQMFLDTSSDGAVIQDSWALVDAAGDPMRCGVEGAAELVPGSDNVFGACKDHYTAMELDDPTGNTGNPPPVAVWLPDGKAGGPFCTSGGPTDVKTIRGWHRAFPLATVGAF